MNKLRVMISGLVYPVTMMRMFWEELERREDIELFSCGPFFDDWIPWRGGITIPRMYIKVPTYPLSREMQNYHVHPQMLKDLVPDDLDLWIQIDAGFHLSARPNAKKVVLVETDPHCVPGDTMVATNHGILYINELSGSKNVGVVGLHRAVQQRTGDSHARRAMVCPVSLQR